MKTIWKYELHPFTKMEIPSGAKILDVQTQGDSAKLWALVDTSNPMETRVFTVYGTGLCLPDNPGEYVGTFQLSGGALVFHVFEEKK